MLCVQGRHHCGVFNDNNELRSPSTVIQTGTTLLCALEVLCPLEVQAANLSLVL